MNKKDYKLWSWSVLLLELFCVYQMFYAPPTRFTIVCAYLTIAILFVMVWFSQHIDQQFNKKMKNWHRDLEKMNDEIDRGIKNALRLQAEGLKNGSQTNSETTGTKQHVPCYRR